MSGLTGRPREYLDSGDLDSAVLSAWVAVRREDLRAMLDVIDAADACLVPAFADLTHEQAVERTDALADALDRFREVAS